METKEIDKTKDSKELMRITSDYKVYLKGGNVHDGIILSEKEIKKIYVGMLNQLKKMENGN